MVLMQSAIEIDKLSVSKDNTQILKNISVSLPQGKVIGLLGPSGAGKTTLIRTLVGRQKITSGAVKVLGWPAGNKALRRQVGYVTQSPSVYEDLTISENLRYFAAMLSLPKGEVSKSIERVGLGKYSKHLVGKLSGGQRSRVSLAAALLGAPNLLLLDEPTVGVDPVLRRELWNQFHDLAEQGCTLVVTSHVMDEASHCDYLMLLRDGELLAHGNLSDLANKAGVKDKNVESIFLKLVESNK